MNFHVGQTVIHPHHGPALVSKVMTRKVRGEDVEYAELEIVRSKLVVSIPVTKADEIGIRDVAGVIELDRLAEVLSGPTIGEEPQWSRRYKANRASIATGDPLQLAAVVRDLVRRRERGSLSLGEKDLLKEASAPLLSEIALAVDVSEDDARDVMFAMIMDESRAALDALDRAEAV
jgi:CarD family transcriptional regulator